jgi:hypothetical protein
VQDRLAKPRQADVMRRRWILAVGWSLAMTLVVACSSSDASDAARKALVDGCKSQTVVPKYDRPAVVVEPGSRVLRCGWDARIAITGDPVAVTTAYADQLGCSTEGQRSPGSFVCQKRGPYEFTLEGQAGAGTFRFKATQVAGSHRWEAQIKFIPD